MRELKERKGDIMPEVPGLETIRGLVGEPPKRIKIPHKIMRSEEMLRREWNEMYIAIIPYCFKCQEPLVWHTPPDNKVLFHCPKCKREWIKGEGW